MKRLFIVILLIAVAKPFEAQHISEHPRVQEATNLLDLWIDAQIAYEQIPGAAVAVVHDQELIWSAGYGFANVEGGVRSTPRTRYSICSISKLFTSIAVLQQRDEGKLRLDDPLREHLPWFNIANTHPEAGNATIVGVLTHSSGLPRESSHPYWTAPNFEFPSREEIIDGLSRQETLYPTSTYFQYSNLGLTLAGEVAAIVSNTTYESLIRDRILEPLGLTRTTTEMPAELWGNQLAVGYSAITREGIRKRLPLFQARGISPAAGYASTVEDLGRFASWQFRTLDGTEENILSRNTLREMHRVHWVDPDFQGHWGLGFSTWRSDDKTFVGHGGSCPGYRSHLALQIDDKVATAFATNALGVGAQLYTSRAYDIMAPAISAAIEGRGKEDLTEDQVPDWTLYTGTYGGSFGGETAMLVWEGELVGVTFPTTDPLASITRLQHIDGHIFRRIRDDDTLGEAYMFQIEGGEATSFVRHSNRYERSK